MHRYKFQLRKPKRWSRRAKSDGSAVPKIKRVKAHRRSAWFRNTLVISACVWLLSMAVPVVLLNLFLLLDKNNMLFLFGISPSVNDMTLIIRLILYAMLFSCLIMNASALIQLMGKRKEARHAIAHRCHLCPRCGYSLQSRTDDTQPCPECGQRISRREAVRLWCRFCR